ncbi:MAG TPA: pyridoxal 5'-phosphate synthase glutaminase subunit PdxT, partial [Candidatus Acetothermia bacterium]|nr:pyridoxal 5'-phosphate synthase glutaminase subunit PdxT [Candidatus Acetothermia bacterium]
ALARYDGAVVMAREGNVLVTSFHPELTDDLRIHRYFTEMVENYEREV